jgi:hypothetical protein
LGEPANTIGAGLEAFMSEKSKAELLEAEYFKLQDFVEIFDERALQIKGWSVTVSLAALVTAFASADRAVIANRDIILSLALLSAIAFWYIEFTWKCFQWSFLHRITEIEAYMRDPSKPIDPLQIRTSWRAHYKTERSQSLLRGKFLAPSVSLPHAGIIIVATFLIVNPFGWV